GTRVAFATVAFDRVQSVSILQPNGIRAADRPRGLLDRFLLAITSWQETGSVAGVGRVDITLKVPARRVRVALTDTHLEVAITGSDHRLSYHLTERTLQQPGSTPGYEARLRPHVHRGKPLVF